MSKYSFLRITSLRMKSIHRYVKDRVGREREGERERERERERDRERENKRVSMREIEGREKVTVALRQTDQSKESVDYRDNQKRLSGSS